MTRLVLFDCDGTLVDSQHVIVACMQRAFVACDVPPPTPEQVRRIVGRSLSYAIADLWPAGSPAAVAALTASYVETFRAMRAEEDVNEALFPGVRPLLELLEREGRLLGIATGKGLRGLELVLAHHALSAFFVTLQTADHNPSKPHPGMVLRALAETGCDAGETVVVGDTSFDIAMARAAGARAIGVAWGNHPADELVAAGAECVIESFEELPERLGPT